MTIVLDLKSSEPAALLALEELKRYIGLMDKKCAFAFGKNGITLEVNPSLLEKKGLSLPNPELDDAVYIEVSGGSGTICGSNARALLIAVYKFLEQNGVCFIKPGKNGEIIPKKDAVELRATLLHAASYRHRGVCIEGSNTIENVLDIIEWLPKAGMNTYFVQFLTPFIFFERYYGHEWNPSKKPERLTKTIINGFVRRIKSAALERGLSYHAVGHGWTCEPLGIAGLGWFKNTEDYPPEVKNRFALVNGKRELWGGIPLNTNLCYSNEETRDIITDAIACYAQQNPETDVIHFWLADGSNNQCECESCAGTRPADFYVKMLNSLDEKLTARGLKTRIVFLIYVDLLWRPLRERLVNSDRFILMFAPISRRYSQTLKAGRNGKTTDFVLNKLTFPKNVDDSVAYLREWQEVLPPCDSFIFDYHFMWDYIKEPGGLSFSRTLFEDMKNLDALGLNGMVSCQNQRVFHPTGLGMRAMAQALWDKTQSFEDVAARFYADAFGKYASEVAAYLKQLSETYPANAVRHDEELFTQDTAARFDAAALLCAASRPRLSEIAQLSKKEGACVSQNFAVLLMHNRLTEQNAKLYAAHARGDDKKAIKEFNALAKMANKFEDKMQTEFDMELYLSVCNNTVRTKKYALPVLED